MGSHSVRGTVATAEERFRESEALARHLNVPTTLWQALSWRGRVAEFEGDDERAVPLYEAALAVARELDDPEPLGTCLLNLSDAAYRRGDLQTAERFGEEAVAALRAAGPAFMLSVGLATIGQVAIACGDTSRAVAAYQEALDLALGLSNDWLIANALVGFAAVMTAHGDYAESARLLGVADRLREVSHHPRLPHHFHHTQTMQAVRTALGESAFTAAWEAGRAWSVDEAITFVQHPQGSMSVCYDCRVRSALGTYASGRSTNATNGDHELLSFAAMAPLFDPFDDCPHCLMRHPEVARHGPKPFSLNPNNDLRPLLSWDAWSFGRCRIPSDTRPLSRP